MAKKKQQETRTKLEEINDSLSGIEQKFEQHKNLIYWIVLGVLIIALLIWAYFKFIYGPNLEKANNELSKADVALYMQQDTATALKGYEKVAKNYSNPAANMAKFNAARLLFAKGDKNSLKKALNYLEDYSPKGTVVGPASQSLLGDCYVNEKKYDKALACYDKAIKLAGDNKTYIALFMEKKANVLHFLKKYTEELAILRELETKYVGPGRYDARIEQAKAMGGKEAK